MSRCMIGPDFSETDLLSAPPDDGLPPNECNRKAKHTVKIKIDTPGYKPKYVVKLCEYHYRKLITVRREQNEGAMHSFEDYREDKTADTNKAHHVFLRYRYRKI